MRCDWYLNLSLGGVLYSYGLRTRGLLLGHSSPHQEEDRTWLQHRSPRGRSLLQPRRDLELDSLKTCFHQPRSVLLAAAWSGSRPASFPVRATMPTLLPVQGRSGSCSLLGAHPNQLIFLLSDCSREIGPWCLRLRLAQLGHSCHAGTSTSRLPRLCRTSRTFRRVL